MLIDSLQRSKVLQTAGSFVPLAESFTDGTITRQFKSIAARYGAQMAVVDRESRMTYDELDHESDCLAEQIIGRCGSDLQPVALLLPQGARAVVAILGVLKARKIYVPFSCSARNDPLTDAFRDIRPALTLTDDENHGLARAVSSTEIFVLNPDAAASESSDLLPRGERGTSDDVAYIFLTSGTTGRPKGVIDTHRNVLHNVMRYTNSLAIGPHDRISLLQDPSFSGSVSSLFCALLNGACVFPIDLSRETLGSLALWLKEQSISIYHSVPTIFRGIAKRGQGFPSIRIVRLEGDRATRRDLELFQRHFPDRSVLVNGLGTTETGLVSQCFMDRRTSLATETLPVGFPASDMQFSILDRHGGQLPSGSVGEIAVTSRYLATGYWQRPDLTNAAFRPSVDNPGNRTYRTGDLGRIAEDGSLEYLGRADSRVRLRGRWILPALVEEALCSCAGIDQAAVTIRGEIGNEQLVAFYTQSGAQQPGVATLREQLSSQLPTQSLPSRFIGVEELPTSSNGKIDHSALPQLDRTRPNVSASFVQPYSLLQRRLVELWCDVLRLDRIGVRDDFFELGGDSLRAIRMIADLELLVGRQLPPDILVGNSTIEKLADALFRGETFQAASTILNAEGKLASLFYLHGDYVSGGLYVRELAHHLGPERPVVAIRPCGVAGESIPPTFAEMAKNHLSQIRDVQPNGPYLLAGQCNGGLVAYEIARLLAQQGETVSRLVLIHTSASNLRYQGLRQNPVLKILTSVNPRLADQLFLWLRMQLELNRQGKNAELLRLLFLRPIAKTAMLARRSLALLKNRWRGQSIDATHNAKLSVYNNRSRLRSVFLRIDHLYFPPPYGGRIVLLWPEKNREEVLSDLTSYWEQVCENVELRQIPGNNRTCFTRHVDALAQTLNSVLGE